MLVKVNNINTEVSDKELMSLFSVYGDCEIVYKNEGVVYFEYNSDDQTRTASKELDKLVFNGKKLDVTISYVPAWVLQMAEQQVLSSWNQMINPL